MKTLLLLMLLATSAHADLWFVNGKTYKGTIHRFNADSTLVWVTSDWDNYRGSWIKVAELDSATRVRLQVATPKEQSAVSTASPRATAEAAQRMQAEEQAEARIYALRMAQIELQQRLAFQRQTLEFARRQAAQQRRSSINYSNNYYYIAPSSGYSGYSTYSRGSYGGVSVLRAPAAPYVPCVPHVVQPILLWNK